ncbi:MAG: OB-fold nucleic acid binding domain-containing protein [Candidatus Pacearchaeota archaeon]
MPEIKERATAYKLRIGDILSGKPVTDNEKLNFLEIGEKKVVRVNVVANVIEKYVSEGEKKYLSFTIDDASGQIKIKAFGDDVERFKGIEQGNTLVVIGLVRQFNNEIYILPEILKPVDPRYLLLRKLELEAEKPKEISKEEAKELKDKILEMIKNAETEGGIDADKIIINVKADPQIINQEIQKLLESGQIYEPRPGKLRFLG